MLAAALSGFSPKSAYACSTLCAPGSCSPGCGVCAGWGAQVADVGVTDTGVASRASPGAPRGRGCCGSAGDQTPRCLFHRKKNERAQEVCSGLFVLDKPFALFVLLLHAVLGRGVSAMPKQTLHLHP